MVSKDIYIYVYKISQVVVVGRNPPVNAGDMRLRFNPWVGKVPWRRKWQPTLVFLPGKSHEQRSLVGYSPWGCKRARHDLAAKQQRVLTIHKDRTGRDF